MKLLLVEDDLDDLEVLSKEITKIRPAVVLQSETARDAALQALNEGDFDLIVCDLRIPTEEGALDDDVSHGMSVVDSARRLHPGTPIFILSAFADVDYAEQLISRASQQDVYGIGNLEPMLTLIQKKRMPDCIDKVKQCSDHIGKLDDIAVDCAEPQGLSHSAQRVLRIFARRLGGALVKANPLSGGLSGSTVIRVRVLNARSDTMANAVAKIGGLEDILDEERRYFQGVSPILGLGDFAPIVDRVLAGASAYGGLFYSVAQGDKSLLELLSGDPGRSAEVVPRLEQLEQPWLRNAPTDMKRVQDLREPLLDAGEISLIDEFLSEYDWRSFEARKVMVKTARQHGDLHPGNIIVKPDLSPTIVDFGRVGVHSAALDPISLELSLIFHPGTRGLLHGWPSAEEAAFWPDADRYADTSPVAAFIRACREWALQVCTSRRECHAVAYAVAVRQFKFPDTDHELAAVIAQAAADAF